LDEEDEELGQQLFGRERAEAAGCLDDEGVSTVMAWMVVDDDDAAVATMDAELKLELDEDDEGRRGGVYLDARVVELVCG